MPEGDTIHKLAAAMAPWLEGRRIVSFRLRDDRSLDLAGRRVETVRAEGKHLWIAVEGGLVVRTHLGMRGSWHRYAPGEGWRRAERRASLVLATADDVLVCFDAQVAECLRVGGAREAEARRRLGPDLVGESEPPYAAVVAAARRLVDGASPVADVLLHQGVACGIGNVYKSEVLFLQGVHPLRRLEAVGDEALEGIYRAARRLLRANLGGAPRVTRDGGDGRGRTWVYGRGGRPCLVCGARIERALLGRGRRVTTWCPACQT